MPTQTTCRTIAVVCLLVFVASAGAQSTESDYKSTYNPPSKWSLPSSSDSQPEPQTIENPLVNRSQSSPAPPSASSEYSATGSRNYSESPQYPATSTPTYSYDNSPTGDNSARQSAAEEPAPVPQPSPNAIRMPVGDNSESPYQSNTSPFPASTPPLEANAPPLPTHVPEVVQASAETPIDEPAALEKPASAPLKLAPRHDHGHNHDDDEALKPNGANAVGALGGVAGSLAVVLGIFFAIVWFSRRYLPQASSPLPKEAVELLGWAPLAGRQQMQLIRIGNKLVLISVSNGTAEPLTEITDLLEVERLSALCRRSKKGSSTASFQQVMSEFEREPATGFVGSTQADATSTGARTGRTLGRLGAAVVVALSLCFAGDAIGQTTSSTTATAAGDMFARTSLTNPPLPEGAPEAPSVDSAINEILSGGPEAWASPKRLSSSLQIMVLLTVLSLAPALLLMTTSFVRIIVVLGLLKQALGTQQLPPSQVMTALALFMTLLVMTPTWREVYNNGIVPYSEGKITNSEEAWNRCVGPIKRFLSQQIEVAGNSDDVWLFYDYLPEAQQREEPPTTYDEIPLQALLPAFMLSELKTAFLIGFQIYLPFLILDLVVSSVTISMGMMMLPPVMISLPLKLLLFVLVDGWNLVVGMLLESFGPAF